MAYDKELIAKKLLRWEGYLNSYRLPEWKDIPNFGLYMEQVTVLLQEYLDYLPRDSKDEQYITPTTINNYVRKKVMPKPEKKRYYRTHIAYLVMICSLKQCLSIPTLKTIIPIDLSEDELEKTYTAYINRHRLASEFFVKQAREAACGILGEEPKSELSTDSTEDLIISSAVIGGFSRILAEKLLLLSDVKKEDIPE